MDIIANFDVNRYELGKLCKYNHEYESTGKTLRFLKVNRSCVECDRKRRRKYREKCPEQVKASAAKYRKDHPDRKREQDRKYREKNEKILKDKKLIYRNTHKEEIALTNKNYQERNREHLKQKSRNYYYENRDTLLEKSKEYRLTNREKMQEYLRQYYQENKESIAKVNKEYKEQNRTKYLEYGRKYYKVNKKRALEYQRNRREDPLLRQRYNIYKQNRRARLKCAHTFSWTKIELKSHLEKFSNSCAYCGSDQNNQIDHFLALSKGGSHVLSNLVLSCRECNCSKQAADPFEWYSRQFFFSKKRWLYILKVLGKTQANYNQITLF